MDDSFVRDGINTALGQLKLCLSGFFIACRNGFFYVFDRRTHFRTLTHVVSTAFFGLAGAFLC